MSEGQQRQYPARTFEIELANLIGVVAANLGTIMERNPDLPVEARTALVRTSWKLMPLTDAAAIRAMRAAYEPWLYSPVPDPSEESSPDGIPS